MFLNNLQMGSSEEEAEMRYADNPEEIINYFHCMRLSCPDFEFVMNINCKTTVYFIKIFVGIDSV